MELMKVRPDPRQFAVIGTRACTGEQLEWVKEILDREFERDPHAVLHTGNAPGIDQAAMDGWLERKGVVFLHLPWSGFESHAWSKWTAPIRFPELGDGYRQHLKMEVPALTSAAKQCVMRHHPAWQRLSQAGRKLQFRNHAIVAQAETVYATPGLRYGGGGTAMGIKLARHLRKDLVVFDPENRDWAHCGCGDV